MHFLLPGTFLSSQVARTQARFDVEFDILRRIYIVTEFDILRVIWWVDHYQVQSNLKL